MSILGRSKQEQYGAGVIKRIQKAAKPSVGDIGIGVLKSIQTGLQDRVKNNLERINSNFEDEELRLTNLYNDYADTDKMITELQKKGNGNLVTGLMYDKIDKVKGAASIDNLQARINAANPNDNLFAQLNKEAQAEAKILEQRLEELGKLRTSYDPDNPDEGILATNLQSEAQFKAPIKNSIKKITLSQKQKGSNNALDVVMSALNLSSRNDYSMMDDFYTEETNIDNIIKSTISARDALPVYSGDSELLRKYVQEKTDDNNGKGKVTVENVSSKFTKLMGAMNEFTKLDLKLEGDGSFYFFPSRDDNAKKLKSFTQEELKQFTDKTGYTVKDINEIYFQASAFGEAAFKDNSNVLIRLEQSAPTMVLSEDNEKRLAAIEARETYRRYGYDINTVPEEKRLGLVNLLQISIPGVESVSDDVYVQKQGIINGQVPTNLNSKTLTLYNRLNSTQNLNFNYAVIAHANKLVKQSGLEENKAFSIALNVQKLGLVSGDEFSELFGLFIEGDIESKVRSEEFLNQPLLPYDSKRGRIKQPNLDDYDASMALDEIKINSLIQEINKLPVYFYEPESITTKNPEMFQTGTRFQIGPAIVTFNREADINGNRWTRTQ